ncbi:MAG: cytochrome-c oxidase, cbb3-type subunit III [Lautropia sp.]|nr:cytochrome-c oxidase, cbb3-type subunit III [Lautropia sp.]
MADFISDFWSFYVAGLVVLSLLFCLFVLIVNSRKPKPSADNTTGHVWDGDIREANNPLPRWWMGLYLLSCIFGIGYLVWYPGIFKGIGDWTSAGQYQAERTQVEETLAPIYAGFIDKPVEELVSDPKAMAIGQRLFLNNCAQCHGADARGGRSFPNLTDGDWLHGGSAENIIETITNGRIGIMPPQAEVFDSPADIENVAQYVLSLSGSSSDAIKAQKGKKGFAACAACHGPDGKGNQDLGAPNLTDRIWLHGGGMQNVMNAINKGFNNQMPAHKEILTKDQIHVLAAYVMSLSEKR